MVCISLALVRFWRLENLAWCCKNELVLTMWFVCFLDWYASEKNIWLQVANVSALLPY